MNIFVITLFSVIFASVSAFSENLEFYQNINLPTIGEFNNNFTPPSSPPSTPTQINQEDVYLKLRQDADLIQEKLNSIKEIFNSPPPVYIQNANPDNNTVNIQSTSDKSTSIDSTLQDYFNKLERVSEILK
jgi:hypothetical protein